MDEFLIRFAPITEGKSCAMIQKIRGAKIIEGVRERPLIDTADNIYVLLKVSYLVEDPPCEIRE